MGVSTDAILFYGLTIDDDSELHEQILSDRDGGEDGDPVPGTLAWLWYMGDEVEGCTIAAHCSREYPLFYIAVEASRIVAWRGRPMDVTSYIESLEAGPDWDAMLKAFCARFGVPWEEPKWWLVSYWG
jgi:hypothetical protein